MEGSGRDFYEVMGRPVGREQLISYLRETRSAGRRPRFVLLTFGRADDYTLGLIAGNIRFLKEVARDAGIPDDGVTIEVLVGWPPLPDDPPPDPAEPPPPSPVPRPGD